MVFHFGSLINAPLKIMYNTLLNLNFKVYGQASIELERSVRELESENLSASGKFFNGLELNYNGLMEASIV